MDLAFVLLPMEERILVIMRPEPNQHHEVGGASTSVYSCRQSKVKPNMAAEKPLEQKHIGNTNQKYRANSYPTGKAANNQWPDLPAII
ncbi:hypothetical protein L9F63_022422, partial [Diploptera punctata]